MPTFAGALLEHHCCSLFSVDQADTVTSGVEAICIQEVDEIATVVNSIWIAGKSWTLCAMFSASWWRQAKHTIRKEKAAEGVEGPEEGVAPEGEGPGTGCPPRRRPAPPLSSAPAALRRSGRASGCPRRCAFQLIIRFTNEAFCNFNPGTWSCMFQGP